MRPSSLLNRKSCGAKAKAFGAAIALGLMAAPAMANISTTITGGGGTANGVYSSFASAITALNAATITSPVTVTLAGGQTEALSAAIILTNTGTAAAPITITKDGGINPELTAYTGTSTNDAMFVLNGSDYVTIDGLTLNDGAGSNATTGMDNGFVLARVDGVNGCQHVTIKNCVVKLSDVFATTGISSVKVAYPEMTTAITPTSFSGTNSMITIQSDSVFAVTGISFVATPAANASAPQTSGLRDSANMVGGPLAADGNFVFFGSSTLTSAQNGIVEIWNYDFTTRNNTVVTDMGSLGHSSAANACRGIFYNLSSPGANGTIDNNTVYIKSSAKGTTSALSNTNAITAIMCEMSNAYAADGKIAITNNRISANVVASVPASGSAIVPFCGIAYDSKADTVEISGNEISNYQTGASENTLTRNFLGIYQIGTGSSTPQGFLKFANNNIHDISFGSATTGASTSNIMTLFGMYPYYTGALVTGNTVTNVNKTSGYASSNNIAFQAGSVGASTLTPNYSSFVFRNNHVDSFGVAAGHCFGLYAGTTALATIDSNAFNHLYASVSSTSRSDLVAIALISSAFQVGSAVAYNTISNVNSEAMVSNVIGFTAGIYCTANSGFTFHHNDISNISGGNTSISYYVSGIATPVISGSAIVNIYNNKIKGIIGTGAGLGPVVGITTGTTGNTFNIYNNYIADLSAPNYNNTSNNYVYSVNGIHAQGSSSTTYGIYNNTIVLGRTAPLTTTGSNFSASGIMYVTSANDITIQNNLVNVSGVAVGTGGYIAAIRCYTGSNLLTAGTAPTNLKLKNNILRTNSGANNWLYVQTSSAGAMNNAYTDSAFTSNTTDNIISDPNFNTPCGLFKTWMQGNAQATFTEDNLTLNGNGYYTPVGTSLAEGGAAIITSPDISKDILGIDRGTPPDVGAIEFGGTPTDLAAPLVTLSALPAVLNCASNISFSAVITDASGVNNAAGMMPRLYFRKAADTNSLAGWHYTEATNVSGNDYEFTFDFSLLGSTPTPSDTIQYFVVAQDLSANNYVGISSATFNTCATSVALQSGNFPVLNTQSLAFHPAATLAISYDNAGVCPGSGKMLLADITRVDNIPIGSGTTTTTTGNPIIFTTTTAKRSQIIFTGDELAAAGLAKGNIQGLTWEITIGNASILNLNIKMGTAPGQTFANTTFLPTPVTSVFDAPYNAAVGFNTVNFSTPYYWDGVSDILIEVCVGSSNAGGATVTMRGQSVTGRTLQRAIANACGQTTGTASPVRVFTIFKGNKATSYNNFVWNNGSANLGVNNDTITVTPPFTSSDTATYTLNVSDDYGCALPQATATLYKLANPIAFVSTTPTNSCGGTATMLNAGTPVVWSPAAGLYTDASATTAYTGTALQTVYALLNNNGFRKGTSPLGGCSFADSVLVSVPSTTSIQIANINSSDSSYVNSSSEVHNSSCQLIANLVPNGGSPLNSVVIANVALDGSVQNAGGAPYVTRHYEITPNSNGSTATANVTLYFTQAEFDAYNTYLVNNSISGMYPSLPAGPSDAAGIANVRLTKYEGAGATPSNNTGSMLVNGLNVVWDATLSAWKVSFDVTGFSSFYLHTNTTATPLPVKFVNFTAIAQDNANMLNWATAESAKGNFDVLHSVDGKSFETLDVINTNETSRYSFMHVEPAGVEFYKIAFKDELGHVYYSNTQMVSRSDRNNIEMVLFPNPAKQNTVNIDILNAVENCTYSITDVLGREVKSGVISVTPNTITKATINIDGLKDGIYNFKVVTGNVQLLKKMVKISK